MKISGWVVAGINGKKLVVFKSFQAWMKCFEDDIFFVFIW
jgi:hypothetical protein